MKAHTARLLNTFVPVAATVAGLAALIFIVIVGLSETQAEFFMPHAHCYLFNPQLMLLHGGSDFFIGLAYVAISTTLVYLVFRSRKELPFHWMMLAFALFIVACGATHFMEVWTLRTPHPPYWLAGWVKLLTALASIFTAVLLPPLVPKIRGLLASSQLAAKRKTELEQAYAELSALYAKTLPALQKRERDAENGHEPVPGDEENFETRDLAQVAREVTVHARELERSKHQAESANRAKDQFLAVLSHELRTPLTPALAAASSLENAENIDPAELRTALSLIRRNIELEARLVDDLLDLTRISKGKLRIHFSTIDLHETLRHAAEMCQSEAHNKRSRLQLQLAAQEHHILGDGARLAQVVWNLITNAVKFTPAGGGITVRSSNPLPGIVRIEISDDGIGIEPEMLTRIFEPFQQGEVSTTRQYGGLGLGLSVAKGLVDAHGGSISVHSPGKGGGATFRIDLTTTERPPTSKIPPFSQPENEPRRIRILLVEDHADTLTVLERLLTRWGHQVRTAMTVTSAVEVAAEFPPDLLLSDVGLPDGTGMDLLGKIHRHGDLLAIAMSGYGMEADLEKTRQAGFCEHLIKPVTAERLKAAIDQFFHKKPARE